MTTPRFLVLTLAAIVLSTPLAADDLAKTVEHYQIATRDNPKDANAWEQLGLAQHGLGSYQDAAASFRKALEAGYPTNRGKYNLACALARSGDANQAINLLTELLDGGSPVPLAGDPDLDSLRSDPRFQKLTERAAEIAEPCKHPDKHPEFRQLDFWVGDWEVFARSGPKVGESRVELILKDCVVYENWTGGGGSSGKSFNKYNTAAGKWEQFWVEDNGVTTFFTGDLIDGEMRYVHQEKQKDGTTLIRHMTFSKLPGGKVRQFSERSVDGEKTWSTEYDFTYVPKKQ